MRSRSLTNIRWNNADEGMEKIRCQSPIARSRLLAGIIDKKLKRLGGQEISNHEILQECQEIIKEKVLYYMNMLDEAEVRYLRETETLVYKLNLKQTLIQKQIMTIEVLEKTLKQQDEVIEQLKQQNKILDENFQREVMFKEQDSKKYISVSKLENTNREFKARVEELQQEYMITQQKIIAMKEETTSWRGENKQLQNQVLRLKTRLQESTEAENVKLLPESRIHYVLSISIKPENRPAKKEHRFLRQVMIQGLILQSRASRKKDYEENLFDKRLRQTEVSSQTVQLYLQIFQTKDITLNRKDLESKKNLLQKSPPYQKDAQDTKIQRLKEHYKMQYNSLQKETKKYLQQLICIHSKRVDLLTAQKSELHSILSSLPSREQDILYINELLGENQKLIGLCGQANERADKAYEAMRLLKTQLERYKDNAPFTIRPKTRGINMHTIAPSFSSSMTHRINSGRRKSRSKSRDEDLLITSVIRDSFDLSVKGGRRLNSSLAIYRDDYRGARKSIV